MRARTRADVRAGGVLARLDCEPPLTVRRIRADDPQECALCVVGTAAGPLSGDDLELALDVGDGARLSLRATGASIAQGRHGDAARMRTAVRMGDAARVTGRPGAVVVCAGASVEIGVRLDLGRDAFVDWRETVVLGRTAESSGRATLRWDVERAGRPVLRQFVDLADAATAGWSGMTGRRRVLAGALLSGPGVAARTVVAAPTAVAARLDGHTALVTVLADDTATAQRQVEALCRELTCGKRGDAHTP